MPSREQQLLDRMWERVRPLLPPRPPQPKGGHPFADDKACFAGIVYQLRNAIRWNDMPVQFPSGMTCWRRHRDWTKAGVWPKVWKFVMAESAAAGMLDTRELFLDATFAESRTRGQCVGRTRCGVGVKVKVVTDAHGIPIGVVTDAAGVAETHLAGPALADIPAAVPVPPGAPVVADRAYDSDPLRAFLASQGYTLVAPHRKGRKRLPTGGGSGGTSVGGRWNGRPPGSIAIAG